MGAGITSGECGEEDTVNVTEEEVSGWLYTPVDIYMTTVVMPVIWSLSLLINLTFLFVVFRVRRLRSDTNMYLVHIAIADLLFVSLAFGFRIWGYLASPLAFHTPFVHAAGCICFSGGVNATYNASIILVTAVTFERYLALCHPIKHLGLRGRKRTYKMIVVCWLVGWLFSIAIIPGAFVLNVRCFRWPDDPMYEDFPSSYAYCGSMVPWVADYAQPLLNVPWFLALVANNYMYVRIIQMLNKRTGNDSVVSNDPKATQIRNQVAKMLVVNGLVFFLCQTPYRIFSYSRWICSLAGIPDPLRSLGSANWIGGIPQYINTLVNPLIYGAINKQYRVAFREAFGRKRCANKRAQPATSTTSFATNSGFVKDEQATVRE